MIHGSAPACVSKIDPDAQVLTGKNVDITESLVKTSDGPSVVVPLGLVQAGQGVVGVLLHLIDAELKGQVLELGVVPDDDLQTGSDTVVASKLADDGTVVGDGEELAVSGGVGSEDQRVDVGVGKVDSEVFLGLVQ